MPSEFFGEKGKTGEGLRERQAYSSKSHCAALEINERKHWDRYTTKMTELEMFLEAGWGRKRR